MSSIKSYNLNTNFSDNNSKTIPRWTFPENLIGIKGLKIKNAMIPLTLNNIDTYNNVLSITETISTTTYANTITLPVGQYNSSNIKTQLQTSMNSLGNLYYTVGFNTFGNALTISNSTGTFSINSVGNNAYDELGFGYVSVQTNYTTSSIDLSGIKQLNVVSNINAVNVVGQNYSIVCSIPIEESLNTISTYTDDGNDYLEIDREELCNVELSLRDEVFRPINVNKDWNITINFLTD